MEKQIDVMTDQEIEAVGGGSADSLIVCPYPIPYPLPLPGPILL